MKYAGLSVWGDSIAKGVIFDEQKGRYGVYRNNCFQRLSREKGISVENFSVMGHTSEDGLLRMRAGGLKAGRVAVIEFGGNDCDLDWRAVSEHPEREQFGRVPLERFLQNLTEMVQRTRDAGMLPVMVLPLPLIAQRYFDWVSHGLSSENILQYLGDVEHIFRWQDNYARHMRSLAAELDVRLIDIRSAFLERDDLPELMCVDGIHPNPQGYDFIYQTILPIVEV